MFGRFTRMFQEADLTFLNLEHSLSRTGRRVKGKFICNRGAPELVEGLVDAQFDVISVANNHILDFGEEAFFETLSILDTHSLPYVGAGRNLAEARKPFLVERNGLRIGLISYSSTLPQGYPAGPREPGVNPIRVKTTYLQAGNLDETPGRAPEILTWAVPADLQRMKRDIQNLKKRADVILVYQHWGASMVHEVHNYQREIGKAAIDSGADAVFGGHAHVMQAVEFYRGKPIIHCTGNFLFDVVESFFTPATRQNYLFGCTLTKGGVRDPYLLPCRTGVGVPPVPLSPHRGEGREIVQSLKRYCEPFGTRLKVKEDRVLLSPPKT